VGGVSQRSVSLPYGQPLGVSRLFPVRGYGNGELSGTRVATGTVEYRVPVALIGRSLGHLPVGADRVWLNLFADAGDAWTPPVAPRLTRLYSSGLELAAAIAVNYDLLLQLRFGVAEPLAPLPSGRPRHARFYLAFASDF
jgi:hemolysin activation/secretion protein